MGRVLARGRSLIDDTPSIHIASPISPSPFLLEHPLAVPAPASSLLAALHRHRGSPLIAVKIRCALSLVSQSLRGLSGCPDYTEPDTKASESIPLFADSPGLVVYTGLPRMSLFNPRGSVRGSSAMLCSCRTAGVQLQPVAVPGCRALHPASATWPVNRSARGRFLRRTPVLVYLM